MAALPKKLAAMVAAGLLSAEEAQLAAQAFASKADAREAQPQATDKPDAQQGNFVPSDAGRPVTEVPDEVIITDDDIDAAIEVWNDTMPEYDGLLEATEDNKTERNA